MRRGQAEVVFVACCVVLKSAKFEVSLFVCVLCVCSLKTHSQ